MNEKAKRYHLDVLAAHNSDLYSSLIYDWHIVSENLKSVEFDDEYGMPLNSMRGYFARKDKVKYWLAESLIDLLPLRPGDEFEELHQKEDVVLKILKPIPFKIKPQHTFGFREMTDDMLPFFHSEPDYWTLMKIIGIAGYCGKTFVTVCSTPEFGKSSIYDVLNGITDLCPVFKPRSVPGVLNKINSTGNLIFDDVLESRKEVREIMEEFCLQVGGGKSNYINGAMKSANTKNKYSCSLQSITFLYNNIECYKEPEKRYFENMFDNNSAIDSRFLKLKMKGKLTEHFDRDFDLVEEAEKNKMHYIKVAKELLYLQEAKRQNKIKRKWKTHSSLDLKGRRKTVYKEISLFLDHYSESQQEYEKFTNLLDQCILDYKEMWNQIEGTVVKPDEENIE